MPQTAQMLTANHAPRRAAPTGTAAPERPGLASLQTAVPRRSAPSLAILAHTPAAAASFGTDMGSVWHTRHGEAEKEAP
jgi:hypothetical protein